MDGDLKKIHERFKRVSKGVIDEFNLIKRTLVFGKC